MIKANFREWTLDKIDAAFGTTQVNGHHLLDKLQNYQHEITSTEREYLNDLRSNYSLYGGDDWNEAELENKIISPLFVLSKIDNKTFSYFLERDLAATIGEYDLAGRVDGMIATGFRSPGKPFFCMNKYKRESDPTGDPKGQALIEMIVAQQINDNTKLIYGLYIVGSKWRFMVLMGKEYALGEPFLADTDDIFDIFRCVKGLRFEIEELIKAGNTPSI